MYIYDALRLLGSFAVLTVFSLGWSFDILVLQMVVVHGLGFRDLTQRIWIESPRALLSDLLHRSLLFGGHTRQPDRLLPRQFGPKDWILDRAPPSLFE